MRLRTIVALGGLALAGIYWFGSRSGPRGTAPAPMTPPGPSALTPPIAP